MLENSLFQIVTCIITSCFFCSPCKGQNYPDPQSYNAGNNSGSYQNQRKQKQSLYEQRLQAAERFKQQMEAQQKQGMKLVAPHLDPGVSNSFSLNPSSRKAGSGGDTEVDPMIERRRQRNLQLMSKLPPAKAMPGNVQFRSPSAQEIATFEIPGIAEKAKGPLSLR